MLSDLPNHSTFVSSYLFTGPPHRLIDHGRPAHAPLPQLCPRVLLTRSPSTSPRPLPALPSLTEPKTISSASSTRGTSSSTTRSRRTGSPPLSLHRTLTRTHRLKKETRTNLAEHIKEHDKQLGRIEGHLEGLVDGLRAGGVQVAPMELK